MVIRPYCYLCVYFLHFSKPYSSSYSKSYSSKQMNKYPTSSVIKLLTSPRIYLARSFRDWLFSFMLPVTSLAKNRESDAGCSKACVGRMVKTSNACFYPECRSWNPRRNPSEETSVEKERRGRAKGGIKPASQSRPQKISCMELVFLDSVILTSRALSLPSAWVREPYHGSIVRLSENP